MIGSSDPFVVVLVNRSGIGRSRTLFKTQNPVWGEPRDTIPIRLACNTDEYYKVVVQLWDEDLGETYRDDQ